MSASVSAPVAADDPVVRSAADRRMRALLRLPEDGPKVSIIDAHNAFSKSILVSATRCLLTYVVLPLLAPVTNLGGWFGPALGILLTVVSTVAITVSTRRFFAADHKWRWGYAAVGGGILALLLVQAANDVAALWP